MILKVECFNRRVACEMHLEILAVKIFCLEVFQSPRGV